MISTLRKYKGINLPKGILSFINTFDISFNPSYIKYSDKEYLAIRLFSEQFTRPIAFLFIWSENMEIVKINLTAYFREKGIEPVSDPKLCILNSNIYVTFNTGHSKSQNKVLLILLEGNGIKDYYECCYSNRNKIEKNWAFYSFKNNLFVLYSLDPFTVLKVKSFEKNKALCEIHHMDKRIKFKNYTIGTPVFYHQGIFYFIGHKKYYYKGKRLYLGSPFRLTLNEKVFSLKKERKIIFHSFKSLLGNKLKLNKKLISCTYFSGLSIEENDVYLSYGINDIDFKIIQLNRKLLWA